MPRSSDRLKSSQQEPTSKYLSFAKTAFSSLYRGLKAVAENYYTPAESILLGLIAGYIILGYLAAGSVGHAQDVYLFVYSAGLWRFVYPVIAIAVTMRVIYIMVRIVPDRLFHYIAKDLKAIIFDRQRWYRVIPLTVMLTCFFSVFTSLKQLIPAFNAYTWDQSWMLLDQYLHLGWHPWELLQPFIGVPLITYLLNVSYNIWFFVMLAFNLIQVFSLQDRLLRMQYFYTFVLIWAIGGNVLASVFASAGPCYYDTFATGQNPYTGLMDYLQVVNGKYEIWALNAQQLLLDKQSAQGMGMGVGISAMPSMHVATVTLFALQAMRTHRLFGFVMVLYAILIYLGSIHLAWHYAVDGIAGALITILTWYAVAHFLRKDRALHSISQASGNTEALEVRPA